MPKIPITQVAILLLDGCGLAKPNQRNLEYSLDDSDIFGKVCAAGIPITQFLFITTFLFCNH